MARKSIFALIVLGVVAWMQPPLTTRPPRCAAGRFVADGTSAPVFDVHDGTIALAGRCPPTAATFQMPRRNGVPLRASWPGCVGAGGRLHLRGRMDTDCTAIHGVLFEGPTTRPFSAHRVPMEVAGTPAQSG